MPRRLLVTDFSVPHAVQLAWNCGLLRNFGGPEAGGQGHAVDPAGAVQCGVLAEHRRRQR